MPPRKLGAAFEETCAQLAEAYPETTSLGASFLYQGGAETWLQNLANLSDRLRVPLVATNDVMYHCAERRVLQDVVTCIREHCTVEEAGFLLNANAERHIKPPKEMARLFRRYPQAIARTIEIADQIRAGGEVQRTAHQGVIHREVAGAVTHDALLVAHRFG